jgi:two-component system response regulator HydG
MSDSPIRILVVDDEKGHAEATVESLERAGFACSLATSGKEGIQSLDDHGVDIVLTDLVMRDADGLEVLRHAKKVNPDIEVILMTGYASVETAVEAMQAGALMYLKKPLNIKELRAVINKAVERQELIRDNKELRRQLDRKYGFEGIIGDSPQMQGVFDTLTQVSGTNATVLIYGESGTGKELVARAIHNNSRRKNNHFVPLNCAALTESILESELFGHEKGAFTGATSTRKGRFEFAHNGTLFLDEIGDLPMSTQVKLLRVLESGEIVRVGSNETMNVDVRLLAATNKSLEELVQAGEFREDLYFRLKVVTVELPALRERAGDIPILIDHFMKEVCTYHNLPMKKITPEAVNALSRHDWPGNVRELKNTIESMVVLAREDIIDIDAVPGTIQSGTSSSAGVTALAGMTLKEAEEKLIRATLELTDGNREKAATMLDIGERTLYRKIKEYGLK